jgi:hypothetical protein
MSQKAGGRSTVPQIWIGESMLADAMTYALER